MKAEDTELLKEFTPEQVAKLDSIIDKHKGKAGGLIPVLEEDAAQARGRALPPPGGLIRETRRWTDRHLQ